MLVQKIFANPLLNEKNMFLEAFQEKNKAPKETRGAQTGDIWNKKIRLLGK